MYIHNTCVCVYIYIYIYVNNIPHGHALFSVLWYSLVTRGTRCAQKSMSPYNTCDHFGLECCGKAKYANALVPDRLRVKNRPVGSWTCEPNVNGLLDIVVSGGYSDVDRAVSDWCCTQRPLTYLYLYL